MFPMASCSICTEAGHHTSACPELWENKTPPPQKGDHDEDDSLNVTTSGNSFAHDFNQTSGSKAGHLNPLSVINM